MVGLSSRVLLVPRSRHRVLVDHRAAHAAGRGLIGFGASLLLACGAPTATSAGATDSGGTTAADSAHGTMGADSTASGATAGATDASPTGTAGATSSTTSAASSTTSEPGTTAATEDSAGVTSGTTSAGSTSESTSSGDSTSDTEGTSSTGVGCPAGTEGCACAIDETCDGDLVCAGGLCQAAAPVTCGDGVVDPGEVCDDGNDVDHDGCTKLCATTKVLAIDAGHGATCALLSGGAVRCWGGPGPGQFGYPGFNDFLGDDELPSAYGPVVLGGPAVAVAVGADHACARMGNGDLRCWGSYIYGQHGLGAKIVVGDDEDPATVAPVKLGGAALDSRSQWTFGCALLEGGGVRCWGHNIAGELGLGHIKIIGDDEHPDSQPLVKLGEPATQIAVGNYHTCALLQSGLIRCWGTNSAGQIGLGKSGQIGALDTPIDHPPLDFPDVEEIATGSYHTCIRQAGGVVRCWGANAYGELGYGHTNMIGKNGPINNIPAVSLGAPAVKVIAGTYTTCAILEGGGLRCWGHNSNGQLGLGHTMDIGDDELPSDVPLVDVGGPVTHVTASYQHMCALLVDGTVRCWGLGMHGSLGYGNTETIGDDETPASAGPVSLF